MAFDPRVDDALSLLVRASGQLEDVALDFDPHATVRVASEPAADSAHDGGERLRFTCEPDHEGADHQRLDRAGTVGGGTGRGRLDSVHVELEQLGAEAAGESFELLLLGAWTGVDRKLEVCGFGSQGDLFRQRRTRSCYYAH
jgi:hypothetical protein